MRPSRPNAFTLLELLIVILLIAMLAAFVWPEFFGSLSKAHLEESARQLKTVISMCRAESMNTAKRHRITFRKDGSVYLTRQQDPQRAPDHFVRVRESWAATPPLADAVWVDTLLALPDGPPPILVDDDHIEFTEFTEEPQPITDLDGEFHLDFDADGTSNSARWVLRDTAGRGLQMTLDGRLGRVTIEPIPPVDDKPTRPEKLEPPEIPEEQDLSWEIRR
jgi:prepilin-type N-terminal cleavage/methylation domain-containing protein